MGCGEVVGMRNNNQSIGAAKTKVSASQPDSATTGKGPMPEWCHLLFDPPVHASSPVLTLPVHVGQAQT